MTEPEINPKVEVLKSELTDMINEIKMLQTQGANQARQLEILMKFVESPPTPQPTSTTQQSVWDKIKEFFN